MKRTLWIFHPISILVFSIVALILSLFLYIYWYVEVSAVLKTVIEKTQLDPEQFVAWQTWVVILVLSILVGIILIGIFIIFVYQRKTMALYRSQDKFINSFTHELKTPTTSLSLYLETFIKHELPREKQLKYLEYMVADVKRLTSNINGILDLARLETKIYTGDFESVDLVTLVEEFWLNNKYLFRSSKILFAGNQPKTFFCSVNISLFQMLLMNLLTNAMKYNNNATPQITVSFNKANKYVHIDFIDNGIGFDPSEKKKIFDKFYQIDRTDWSYAGGTGLGLYMVSQIVKVHKGKITAESKGINQGAVFRVFLPERRLLTIPKKVRQ